MKAIQATLSKSGALMQVALGNFLNVSQLGPSVRELRPDVTKLCSLGFRATFLTDLRDYSQVRRHPVLHLCKFGYCFSGSAA